jgi:hypothetical protein
MVRHTSLDQFASGQHRATFVGECHSRRRATKPSVGTVGHIVAAVPKLWGFKRLQLI